VLNIQRVFFANPGIRLDALSAWRASGLDARQRELVILRAAYRKQSAYEWHQHVRIARAEGVTDEEINGVREWTDCARFTQSDRALLAWVDALATSAKPSDAAFAAFRSNRSDADVVGITYLITLYFQLAHVMAALDLSMEAPFVGWEV
jgi:AhpD family alkylhydroperoxidase